MNARVRAAEIIKNAKFMVLAVTLDDGTPWVVPVGIRRHKPGVFSWVSMSSSLHSKAIAKRPEISFVIYEPGAHIPSHAGVYCKAIAKKSIGIPGGLHMYNARVTEATFNNLKTGKVPLDAAEL